MKVTIEINRYQTDPQPSLFFESEKPAEYGSRVVVKIDDGEGGVATTTVRQKDLEAAVHALR